MSSFEDGPSADEPVQRACDSGKTAGCEDGRAADRHVLAGVRCAFDLYDDRVMQQPVEQRRSDHAIAEHFTPFAEAAIGRQDDRAALVTGVDELEEQIAAVGADGQVTDLVD